MSTAEYRKYQELRIEALNHGLKGLPEDRIRFHMCWGSYHGPHKYDIPLNEIVDLVLKVRAGCYSIESIEPVPRTRMAGLGKSQIAGRQVAHAWRDRSL
jgi:5-methyltetrahydropteroyltriglutamate--homocysteine methyltransferase